MEILSMHELGNKGETLKREKMICECECQIQHQRSRQRKGIECNSLSDDAKFERGNDAMCQQMDSESHYFLEVDSCKG